MRVDVPEYKTFIEFPDDTPPDVIKGVLDKQFPSKAKAKPTYDELLAKEQSGILDALRPARAVKITAEALASVISGIGAWGIGMAGKQVGTGVATVMGDEKPTEFGKHYQENIQSTLTYQPVDPVAIDIVQKVGMLMYPFQKAGEYAKKTQRALGATPAVEELTGDIVEIGTMALAGGIGAKIRSITKSRVEAFDLAKTMEKSMQDIVDPVQRKAFVDTVIKKSRETGKDPWDVLEETQQSMLPVPARGASLVKVERPWIIKEDGTIITDKGVSEVKGMTPREIGIAKRRVNEALSKEIEGESYVKGVEGEFAERTPTTAEVMQGERLKTVGERPEGETQRPIVTIREGVEVGEVGEGRKVVKKGISAAEARTLKDVLSDIITAIGERGAVGEGKRSIQQTEAIGRLRADLTIIKAKAREAGLSIKQYLVNEGHPAEIADMVSKHSNVASITTPQTWESVQSYLDSSREKQKGTEKITFGKIRDEAVKLIVDRQGNMKREVIKANERLGEDVVDSYNLISGAKGIASTRFNDAFNEIFKGVRGKDRVLLDDYLVAKRQYEISAYNPEHEIGGLAGEAWGDYLGNIRQKLGEKKFQELERRADAYFDRMREGTIDRLLDKGLIDEAEYNLLNQYIYQPTKFIDAIDPFLDVPVKGKKGSVMSSGLQELGSGAKARIETRADMLMQESFNRVEGRIANNEASKSAYEMAKEAPDNGIFSIEKGSVKDPVLIGTMINGERYTFWMDRSIAKEWFNNDPVVNQTAVKWAQILSGAWLVRAMATGYNPMFVLRNLPRDIGLIWGSAEGVKAGYSSFVPTYLAQTGINMSSIFMDVVRDKGIAKEFVENGGSFEFLSTGQGRGLLGDSRVINQVNTLADALGWLGQKSEMMTRVALYKQGLKNGLSKKQAASLARNYLDFSQGGTLTKAIDQLGAPYLNAGIQGSRSIFRGARTNPKLFTWKVSQLMGFASILYLWNRYSNGDTLDKISDRDKVNNFIITSPYQFVDNSGQVRDVYFKIAKDQGQQIFTSMADAIMDKLYTGKFPTDQVLESWGQLISVSPAKLLPPSIQATVGYMTNTDFWRGEPIYKGHQKVHPKAEIDNMVNPVFKWVGGIGLSPKRTEYAVGKILPNNNPLYPMFTGTVNLLSGELSKEARHKSWEQLLLAHPSVRYIAGMTDSYNADKKGVEEVRMGENTRVALTNYEFDNLSDSYIREPSDENRAELMKYIVNQPEKDRERLANRFIKTQELFNIPDRRWWVNTLSMNPEAKAAIFYGKYMSTPEKKREELIKQAVSIKGYVTDRFVDKFVDLLNNDTKKEMEGKTNDSNK